MNEIWKDIQGFEGKYEISSTGKIRSIKRKCKSNWRTTTGIRTVSDRIRKYGYREGYAHVTLFNNSIRFAYAVHRLVALTFIPNPENKPQVNHKNGIRNDNRVENLEWCTGSENTIHANLTGLKKTFGSNKLKCIQYSNNGVKIKEFESRSEAERKTGIFEVNIGLCINGKRKTAGGYIWKNGF